MTEPLALPAPPDGSPAGPNLENDLAFGEMERAAQGKPETQFGAAIEPATPPDWREAATLAEALLARSRDLRAMTVLATARLHTQGLPAYAAVVATIRQHLETMWPHIHPLLDPEDDNDPVQRASIVSALGQPARIVRPLRDMPLASTPRTGPVSWRDIAILAGQVEAEPGRKKLTEQAVRAAFADTDKQKLAALRLAVDGLVPDLVAITAIFPEMPTTVRQDLEELTKLVRDIGRHLARYEIVETEQPAPAAEATASEAPPGTASPARPAARSFASIQSILALDSRDDALHALDLAAAFFRANEPSSPLPLLIDRAKRLAPLPFLDIVRDLAPDGLPQAQMIAGTTGEES